MSGHGLSALVLCTLLGQLITFGQGLPNLRPYRLAGWPDSLVVHTNVGEPLDTDVASESQTLYVGWAAVNDSAVDFTNLFYIRVVVDGVVKPQATRFSRGLPAHSWIWIADEYIGQLPNGFHNIRIDIDSDRRVTESNEDDNSVEQQVAITSTNIIPVRLYDTRSPAPGYFAFNILASTDQRYQVEYAVNVNEWQPLLVFTNRGGVFRFVDDNANLEQRCYRVRLLTP